MRISDARLRILLEASQRKCAMHYPQRLVALNPEEVQAMLQEISVARRTLLEDWGGPEEYPAEAWGKA